MSKYNCRVKIPAPNLVFYNKDPSSGSDYIDKVLGHSHWVGYEPILDAKCNWFFLVTFE